MWAWENLTLSSEQSKDLHLGDVRWSKEEGMQGGREGGRDDGY